MNKAKYKAFWEEVRRRRLQEVINQWGENWTEETFEKMNQELAELRQFDQLFVQFIDSFQPQG